MIARLDATATSAVTIALYLYLLLRGAAPEGSLLAALNSYPLGVWLVPPAIGLGVGLAGAILARSRAFGDVSTAAAARALRPVAYGTGLVALALPLRPVLFHDPAPVLLVGGVLLGALPAAWRLLALGPVKRPEVAVAALTFALGAALVPSWPAPQGDEPHYLVVAHSIVFDGDLDVGNDYLERVFEPYHPGYLSPHHRPGLEPGSRYSMHGVGYPLLLAPAYAVGSAVSPRFAYGLPRLMQVGFLALFAVVLMRLVRRFLDDRAAAPGALALVLLSPTIFAPLHLFPEMPAMLCAAGGFLLLVEKPSRRRCWMAGVAFAALPWLGVKYIPLALTTALAGAVLGGHARGAMGRIAGPLALSGLGLMTFTGVTYGSLSPAAILVGADPGFAGRVPAFGQDWAAYVRELPAAVRTLLGYFLDQKEGLLVVGPHLLLAAAGTYALWRRQRALVVGLTIVLASYLGPYALSQQLGGHSPPARPVMAVLWILALPLAAGLGMLGTRLAAGAQGALVALGAGVTAYFLWDPLLLPHDYGVSASWMLRSVSPLGWEVWRWFPTWVNAGGYPWLTNALWAAVLLALVLVLGRGVAAAMSTCRAADRTAWAAATGTGVVLVVLGLAAAAVPLTDRYQGREVVPGVQAWTIQARPETSWVEPGGVWGSPGSRRAFVLTAGVPLSGVELRVRTMVPTEYDLACGTWSASGASDASAGNLRMRPGAGRAWRGGVAYRGWMRAAVGAAPAAVEGGDDWRLLGVLAEFTGVEFDAR